MSEVEQLYVKLQGTFGGNLPWKQLNPVEQYHFVEAVNAITRICQYTNQG